MELRPHPGGSCRRRAGNRRLTGLAALFGADSIWYAMPVTELVTAVYVAASMKKYTARLPE